MTISEYKEKKKEILKRILKQEEFHKHDVVRPEYCNRCKGACCRSYPCHFSPDEFLKINDKEYMKKILDTGLFIIDEIDSLEGYFEKELLLYIRVRGIRDYIRDTKDYITKNTCILYDNKCLLNHSDRPAGGLLLLPGDLGFGLGICRQYYNDIDLKKDWLPYQDTLKELKEEYGKKIERPKDIHKKVLEFKKGIRQQ